MVRILLACGIGMASWMSNLLTNVAKHIDDLAFIRSMHVESNNHGPALYEMNSGLTRIGFPLHLLGIDHTRLTYRHNGRQYRLTDVAGKVIEPILSDDPRSCRGT